ncbi:MAG: hypothetical protein QOE70_4064 [Chthoniobacter sp.]|jgi:hypothetical protein|nr:hypothetical protein [Chthoniobacter sp.]
MSNPRKYWQMAADKLRGRRWNVACFNIPQGGRRLCTVVARQGDGPKLVIQAEDFTTVFLELEAQCREWAPPQAGV